MASMRCLVAGITHLLESSCTTRNHPAHLQCAALLQVVWDIMRCWVKQHPVNMVHGDAHQAFILAREPQLDANFSNSKKAFSQARADGKARFTMNPDNWGPRPKHGRPMLPHETCEAGDAGQLSGKQPHAHDAADMPADEEDSKLASCASTKRQKLAQA